MACALALTRATGSRMPSPIRATAPAGPLGKISNSALGPMEPTAGHNHSACGGISVPTRWLPILNPTRSASTGRHRHGYADENHETLVSAVQGIRLAGGTVETAPGGRDGVTVRGRPEMA